MSCRVTVLMAVRNGMPYLPAAIDSILHQSYSDFHFLIVDDASTDNTEEVVRGYEDPRIELITLEQNVGQTAALNVGLHHASTRWIARMDADDYSAPTRLEEQMAALDADPALSCLGTFAWTFREDPQIVEGEIITHTQHADIMRALLSGSPLMHGTIVVDRQALLDVGAYTGHYRYSADIEMYDRLLAKHEAAAIPRHLLGVRRHSEQGSRTNVAFDENIEIFQNRLLYGDYTKAEAASVQASLSRFYLFRARRLAGQAKFDRAASDLLSALATSPKSFLHNSSKVFAIDLIPEKGRATIKRLLTRPGVSSGQ